MKLKIKFLKWINVASWMDDLQFFVLFNCISVISGRRKGDYERLLGETSFMVGKISASTQLGTTRPVDQCLTHWSTGVIVSSSMCTYVKSHQACAHTWSLIKHVHIREVCHHIYVLPHSGGDILFICLSVHHKSCPIKTRKPLRYFHETWYKCKAQSEDVQIENKYRNFFTYILK